MVGREALIDLLVLGMLFPTQFVGMECFTILQINISLLKEFLRHILLLTEISKESFVGNEGFYLHLAIFWINVSWSVVFSMPFFA